MRAILGQPQEADSGVTGSALRTSCEEVVASVGTTWIVAGADRRRRRAFVGALAANGRDAGQEVILCCSELDPTSLVGLMQVGLRRRLLEDPPA